jgi:hypothetical protein
MVFPYLGWIILQWTWECRHLSDILIHFLQSIPGNGIQGWNGNSTASFLRTVHDDCHRGRTSFHSCNMQGFSFSTSLATLAICCQVDNSHPDGSEVTSCWRFNLALWCSLLSLSTCSGEMAIWVLHFFYQNTCFYIAEFFWSSWYKI